MHVTKGNLNVNAMYHSSIRHENKVFGIGYSVSRNESHIVKFIVFSVRQKSYLIKSPVKI